MTIRPVKELIAEAREVISIIPVADAVNMHGLEEVLFVDIRDVRELDREGRIPDAFHAPRGMLEFWFDPQSPYHKPALATEQKKVLFCASAWRSALSVKALQEMGVTNIYDLEGGFKAWSEAGGPVNKVKR